MEWAARSPARARLTSSCLSSRPPAACPSPSLSSLSRALSSQSSRSIPPFLPSRSVRSVTKVMGFLAIICVLTSLSSSFPSPSCHANCKCRIICSGIRRSRERETVRANAEAFRKSCQFSRIHFFARVLHNKRAAAAAATAVKLLQVFSPLPAVATR